MVIMHVLFYACAISLKAHYKKSKNYVVKLKAYTMGQQTKIKHHLYPKVCGGGGGGKKKKKLHW